MITNLLKYREIRKLVEESLPLMDLWVGIDDRGREGDFRLINGTKFNPGDRDQDSLYYWDDTPSMIQPDNSGNEDCVQVQNRHGLISYNDDKCSDSNYMKPLYGLCEIKRYTCF